MQVLIAAVFLTVIACSGGGSTEPSVVSAVSGRYNLSSYAGRSLPFDSPVMNPDGTYYRTTKAVLTFDDISKTFNYSVSRDLMRGETLLQQETHGQDGSYTQSGATVTMNGPSCCAFREVIGNLSNNNKTFTFSLQDVAFTYVKQ